MTNEIIIAIISALLGGFVTYLSTLTLERRKEKRDYQLQQQEAVKNRPEMQIIDFKDYISRTGYGIKRKCDIELIVISIENITVKENGIVNAHYKMEHLDSDKWCCVIYTFKNAGKTDISELDIIWNLQRSSSIVPIEAAGLFAEYNLFNCTWCYDKKIRIGESVTLKVCYHKDAIISGTIAASMAIGMIDDNGRYWTQPLFAPQNKTYDSNPISAKDYFEQKRSEIAEEFYRKPYLW